VSKDRLVTKKLDKAFLLGSGIGEKNIPSEKTKWQGAISLEFQFKGAKFLGRIIGSFSKKTGKRFGKGWLPVAPPDQLIIPKPMRRFLTKSFIEKKYCTSIAQ